MDWPNRVALWAEKVFNIDSGNGSYDSTANSLRMNYVDVKTGLPFSFVAGITSSGMNVKISTDNL